MDISMNKLDLMYLTNKLDYNKLNRKILEPELLYDMQFYKERIIKQIEDLLNGKSVDLTVDNCFKNYLMKSIDYFKFIDKSDEIQKNYVNVKPKVKKETNFNLEEINNLMTKPEKEKIGKLTDKLDIKIKYKNERKLFIPQKKIINLRDENLKTKGIKKKI